MIVEQQDIIAIREHGSQLAHGDLGLGFPWLHLNVTFHHRRNKDLHDATTVGSAADVFPRRGDFL